jgi:hypothetical protein
VLYQPLVDRTGERTCGVEALVRWRRADGQMVSRRRSFRWRSEPESSTRSAIGCCAGRARTRWRGRR